MSEITLNATAMSLLGFLHEGPLTGWSLVATAQERVRYGRSGVYDVTVRRGAEVIAEFRGRSRTTG